MSKHPKVFNELFVAMVRAGETGGQLDTVWHAWRTTSKPTTSFVRR